MSFKKEWTCNDCGEVHTRRAVETGLQLPMPHMPWNQREMKHYVRGYFAPEVMPIACQSPHCQGFNQERSRRTFITVGPEILVVQMVRMWFGPTRGLKGEGVKSMDRVFFKEYLDLSEHTIPLPGGVRNMALKYRLHGVVSHDGDNLEGGHYVATVRSQDGSAWIRADDESRPAKLKSGKTVREVAESAKWQAYVLVYQKVGGKMANCI
jgi:ubiquitin C-terminal hydrolase